MRDSIRLLLSLFRVETGPIPDLGKPEEPPAARPRIHLSRALLCLDCEVLFEASGVYRCPSCDSTVTWAVGRSLSRPAEAARLAEAVVPTERLL